MKASKFIILLIFICFNFLPSGFVFAAERPDSLGIIRAIHIGGNYGRNPIGIAEQPKDYYDFLDELSVNWVGISVGIHIDNSKDTTLERIYENIPLPTFRDEVLIDAIRGFKNHNKNVYLCLAFVTQSAAGSQYPVQGYQIGDPFAPNYDSSILPENWPWDPGHPDYEQFTNAFWKSYTEQAVYYAKIAEQEGVGIFAVGAEVDKLFRTRSGGAMPNHFKNEIKALVDSVRQVYSGLITYEMHWGVFADPPAYSPGSDFLWEDAGFDLVGISADFKLTQTPPTAAISVEDFEAIWESIFTTHLIPLKDKNPSLPMLFLEFGYVDAIESPYFADSRSFEPKVFKDNDGNGLDDGQETQANIYEAFFNVNETHNNLIQGSFLWGNDITSEWDWNNSFGNMFTHSIRGKLAFDVVKSHYASYAPLPGIPSLHSPTDGKSNVPTSPVFVWNRAREASAYRIQISDEVNFSNILYDIEAIQDTTVRVEGLLHQRTYYWRVLAQNARGEGQYTNIWSFSTIMMSPSMPALNYPPHGASGIIIEPVLYWNSSPGAETYHLQVSSDQGFSNYLLNDSSLTDTSKQIGPLENNLKYYWRVNALNSGGKSGFTEVHNFKTIAAAPLPPLPVSPAHGSRLIPHNPVLMWNPAAGASVYHLQIAIDSLFENIFYQDSSVSSNSIQVNLENGTRYYWRVRAMNEGGWSTYSAVSSFTTAKHLLPAPGLLSPAHGSEEISITPTLTWTHCEGAYRYLLQLALDSNFTNMVFEDSMIVDTTTQVGQLENTTTYYWRVKAFHDEGGGEFSDIGRFITADVTGIKLIEENVPKEFCLHQNYPNPFNGSTVIRFSMPRADNVLIKITDILGKEISVLLNEPMPAGYFEIQWNAGNLNSGIYFYLIRSGNFSDIKKAVLMK